MKMTNTTSPDLLPCPHCGGKGTLLDTCRYVEWCESYADGYMIACRECYACAAFFMDEMAAVQAWNRRAEAV